MKKDFFCYGERGVIDWVARDWLGGARLAENGAQLAGNDWE